MVFPKQLFENVDFEKKAVDDKKVFRITRWVGKALISTKCTAEHQTFEI